MSLAQIKAKETKKKVKSKPNKVKIFLANPLKPKCASLEESDFKQLQELLKNAIKESNLAPRAFATTAHICLGLESSVRAINNGQAACVLLSSKITPRYILRLMARNVDIKCQSAPTYVEEQLENITESIFGVRTLAMVLPIDNKGLSSGLCAWIEAHKKPIMTKKIKPVTPYTKIKPRISVNSSSVLQSKTNEPIEVEKTKIKEEPVKPWGSNYISFANTQTFMDIDTVNSEEDEDKLLGALSQIAKMAKLQQISSDSIPLSAVETEIEEPLAKLENKSSDSDQDDFLSSYAHLTVHKICSNPNRKPKKNRNKNRKNTKQ